MLSSRNTPFHGIYTVGSSERGKTESRKLIPTKNNTVLHDSVITIADELKQAGYKTASIGKWHIGENPENHGFDINIAGTLKGHPASHFSPYKNKALPDGDNGEYLTTRLTNEAINFIEQNREEKFFLYLPYFTVHTPLQALPDLIQKYKNQPEETNQQNPVYAAMIEAMDDNVGRILKKLRELKIEENTIVIFTSDNGGVAQISSQHPLKYGKGSYYEGGIRVPFIVKWPGKILEKSNCNSPISNLDIYPSLLEIAQISKPLKSISEGQNLTPLFFEEAGFDSSRALYWHFPIYLQSTNSHFMDGRDSLFRTRPGSVVRLGKWKLHQYFEDNSIELYNLDEDIGEENNLAESNPIIVQQLLDSLNNWRERNSAPIPNEINPYYLNQNQSH
jgi:arylsulfatase A-like enzyme